MASLAGPFSDTGRDAPLLFGCVCEKDHAAASASE